MTTGGGLAKIKWEIQVTRLEEIKELPLQFSASLAPMKVAAFFKIFELFHVDQATKLTLPRINSICIRIILLVIISYHHQPWVIREME